MAKPPSVLVTTADSAKKNIGEFMKGLKPGSDLVELLSYSRAWYACRIDDSWAFGPSKFIGYEDNNAPQHQRTRRIDRDGRQTERVLSAWFEAVPEGSSLNDDLQNELRKLFSRFGKSPNARTRISVLKADLDASPTRAVEANRTEVGRVTVNSSVCGGRPCIRGMRIRVSDILELLASGVDRRQILADYPYLESEDIDAALQYAAQTVDHRVVKAA